VVALLLLLGILIGVGTWNYRRNLVAEQAEYRPFRGHGDEAVAQLVAAYESQRERDSKRYQAAAGRTVTVRGKDYFGEQVQEFERIQEISANTRALRDELAEGQTTLKLLKEEQEKRAEERQKMKIFFRRLLTVND